MKYSESDAVVMYPMQIMEAVAKELVAAFGSDYPSIDTCKLKHLCDTRHGGNVVKMETDYVKPTIELVRKLKAKKMPLVQSNKVIVHLFEPKERIGVGEFYFQISKSCPGELAMKFSKFVTKDEDGATLPESRWGYEVENTLVADDELDRIFSLAYLDEIRRHGKCENGTQRTHVNFRLCVVSDVITGKADVLNSDDIFPETAIYTEEHRAETVARELSKTVSDLTTSQIRALARKLDKLNLLSGDYQTLADQLGYKWEVIEERFRHASSPTQEILADMQHVRPNYRVSDLIKDLEYIGRTDAVLAMCDVERLEKSPRGSREELTGSPVQETETNRTDSGKSSNDVVLIESEAFPLEENLKSENSNELQGEDSFHHDIHTQPETPDNSHLVIVTGDQSYHDLQATPFETEQKNATESPARLGNSAVNRRASYKIGRHSFDNIQPDSASNQAAAATTTINLAEGAQGCDGKPPNIKFDCHQDDSTITVTNPVTSPTGTERRNGYIRGVHKSLDNQSTGIKAEEPQLKPTTKYKRGKNVIQR